MMKHGQIVYEKAGKEKAAVTFNELLAMFNQISIEYDNWHVSQTERHFLQQFHLRVIDFSFFINQLTISMHA
jgi:hypothetical protein